MNGRNFPEEHELRLNINGMREVTLICTNAALDELIIGFLANGGIIGSVNEILELAISPDGGSAEVRLSGPLAGECRDVRPSGLGGTELTMACQPPRRKTERRFAVSYILECAHVMASHSPRYAESGGMHCSALFDGSRLLSLFEDIGRHNTLDKIAGDCLLRGLDASDTLLVTTGRVSSDMVRKAGLAGASAIASYSTATDAALNIASAAAMSIVTYLKRTPPNILCGGERII